MSKKTTPFTTPKAFNKHQATAHVLTTFADRLLTVAEKSVEQQAQMTVALAAEDGCSVEFIELSRENNQAALEALKVISADVKQAVQLGAQAALQVQQAEFQQQLEMRKLEMEHELNLRRLELEAAQSPEAAQLHKLEVIKNIYDDEQRELVAQVLGVELKNKRSRSTYEMVQDLTDWAMDEAHEGRGSHNKEYKEALSKLGDALNNVRPYC